MSTTRIAVVPGDGIGTEVTDQAVRVLKRVAEASAIDIDLEYFDLGANHYLETGEIISEETAAALAQKDAIMLGAVGDPRVKPGILERGLLLKLRFAFDQYVNLRPSKHFPGVASPLAHPEGADFVVVREGTEGMYVGNGGMVREGTPQEIATEVSVNTAYAVERVVRYAFGLARSRRQHLTLVHKANVLVNAGGLWQRITEQVAAEFPDVTHDYLHVDAATIFLVTDPQRFDVIVTDNLFGDIITDEAAAVTGGIGLAASGNINPEREFPSMFEPVHGSAPDIAGKNLADPIAAIGSVQLLLDHLDYSTEAKQVGIAVEKVMQWRADHPEVQQSTTEVGDQVLELL